MRIDNPHLDRICATETYREVLDLLPPRALAVVALQLEDNLDQGAIGTLFGISSEAVSCRLRTAQRHVCAALPAVYEQVQREGRAPLLSRCAICGVVTCGDNQTGFCRSCIGKARMIGRV